MEDYLARQNVGAGTAAQPKEASPSNRTDAIQKPHAESFSFKREEEEEEDALPRSSPKHDCRPDVARSNHNDSEQDDDSGDDALEAACIEHAMEIVDLTTTVADEVDSTRDLETAVANSTPPRAHRPQHKPSPTGMFKFFDNNSPPSRRKPRTLQHQLKDEDSSYGSLTLSSCDDWEHANGDGANDDSILPDRASSKNNTTASVVTTPPPKKKEQRNRQIAEFWSPPAKPAAAKKKDPKKQPVGRERPKRVNLQDDPFKDERLRVGSHVLAAYPGEDPEHEHYYWGDITEKKSQNNQWLYNITFQDGDVLRQMISSKYIILPTTTKPADADDKTKGTKTNTPKPERRGRPRKKQKVEHPDKKKKATSTTKPKNKKEQKARELERTKRQQMENLESDKFKDERLVVGSRVFAAFPGDDPEFENYYWGDITEKKQNNKNEWFYNITFHDGDVLHQMIPSKYIIRDDEVFKLNQMTELIKKEKYPVPFPEYVEEYFGKGPMTPKELSENACNICRQCRRKPCGECSMCKQQNQATNTSGSEFQCCIQNMCKNIIPARKAQPAPGLLPDGWLFFFAPKRITTNWRTTLFLIETEEAMRVPQDYIIYEEAEDRVPKSSKLVHTTFLSFEDAAASCPKLFESFDAKRFYQAVGLRGKPSTAPRSTPTKMEESEAARGQKHVDSQVPKSPAAQSVASSKPIVECTEVTYKNLAELRRRRCGFCMFCNIPDCGECDSCQLNSSRTRRFKDACLQRICLNITPELDRRQPAKGFPAPRDPSDGQWEFSFGEPRPDAKPGTHEALRGLMVITPAGVCVRSVEAARGKYPKHLAGWRFHNFYKQIGVQVLEAIVDNRLLNKGFRNEWINLKGERQNLHGRIIKVQRDTATNELKYTVRYNATRNSVGVPETEICNDDRAWSGCLAYERIMHPSKLSLNRSAPFCISWEVPTMYDRRMVNTTLSNGKKVRLPQVTIQHKGFQLLFKAKESTIPNAGYGVFLSCRGCDDTSTNPMLFQLPAGQLLDFGIYAPLRPEDRRNDHEFLMKNFVHNYKCQEYSFETMGADPSTSDIFDITDDNTGSLHFEARRHVTPFVNEVASARDIATVHAMHHSDGAIHYLLGHEKREQGPFQLLVGKEIEIFIDYGEQYEDVRKRQGYSRVKSDPSILRARLEQEELEQLLESETYTAHEVKSTVQFFARMLAHKRELADEVVPRIILVLLLLKKRAKIICEDFEGVTDEDSVCDNGGRDTDSMVEASRDCTRLIKGFVGIWANAQELHDMLMGEELYVAALKTVFTAAELSVRSPTDFVNHVICRE